MSDSRLAALTGFVAVVLAVVVVGGAVSGTRSLTERLTPPAARALSAAGLGDVKVELHGRDATVRGATLDDLEAAAVVVETVPGVRRATVDTAPGAVVRVDTSRPWLTLRRAGGVVRLRGAVPSATLAADLKVEAARAFEVPVRGDLSIDPQLPDAAWTDQLPAAFDDLTDVRALRLVVDGDRVRVVGSIGSTATRDDLASLLSDSLRGVGVELAVTAAEPGGSGAGS